MLPLSADNFRKCSKIFDYYFGKFSRIRFIVERIFFKQFKTSFVIHPKILFNQKFNQTLHILSLLDKDFAKPLNAFKGV